MCGRYLRRSDKQRIAEAFRVAGEWSSVVFAPDFNVAPTTFQPVVRQSKDTRERALVLMRWGLVPFAAKSISEYKGISTINARAESLQTGMWKRLFERHRCLVPADGFYEWQTLEAPTTGPRGGKKKGVKKPFAFTLESDLPFAFAGLWDAWKDPATGEWLQSFAIVTTEANEVMEGVHDRMPVMVHPQDYDRWLDRDETQRLPLDLLKPFDASEIKKQAANPKVGNAANNGPEMLEDDEDEEPNSP